MQKLPYLHQDSASTIQQGSMSGEIHDNAMQDFDYIIPYSVKKGSCFVIRARNQGEAMSQGLVHASCCTVGPSLTFQQPLYAAEFCWLPVELLMLANKTFGAKQGDWLICPSLSR